MLEQIKSTTPHTEHLSGVPIDFSKDKLQKDFDDMKKTHAILSAKLDEVGVRACLSYLYTSFKLVLFFSKSFSLLFSHVFSGLFFSRTYFNIWCYESYYQYLDTIWCIFFISFPLLAALYYFNTTFSPIYNLIFIQHR